ncbi:MAG: AMP-binding protein [Chloroflexota bacterium]
MNLKEMLEASAHRFGAKTAVALSQRRLSYAELDTASNKIARTLLGMGVKPGDRVVLLAENSPEYVAAYFGIVKIGGVAVPLDSKYKLPELQALFEDCLPSVVFGESATLKPLVPRLAEFPSVRHLIDLSSQLEKDTLTYHKIMVQATGEPLEFEPAPDALANINYTSGPTFNPKGVMLSHEHLVKSASIYHDFLNQTEKDVFIQFALPMHHVVGLGALILTAIYGGSSVVILPGLSVEALFSAIEKERGTIFMGVPFVYLLILQEAARKELKYDLGSLRLCIVGAAATPVELIKHFGERFGKKMVQFYGLTEANAFVTCQSPSGHDKPGSVGRPLNGWTIKITDSNGKALPQGHEGEILVAGLITPGYYNKPEVTERTIKEGWLRTGDLGRFDRDGELFITGRIKEMIKVKGQNIYPSDIEKVLSHHPAVAQVKVVGEPEELRGEIVKAIVRLKDGKKATEEELRRFCLSYIANYKIPKKVVFQ